MPEGYSRWRPSKVAKYGVVIYSYSTHKSYPYLNLHFGDVVQILEENAGWYRGFSLREKHAKGIFPASHVHLKDCEVRNPGPDEVVVPKDDQMVQELSDVLREWTVVWKRLYAEGRRQQFQELTQLMRDLLDRRRQILSKTLPRDELKELKQVVGSKIDQGNRMLSMDLVPRDENGSPIDPKTAGVMHLYRAVKQGAEQQSAEANPRVSAFLTPQQLPIIRKDETHLFLKFSALALPVNEPCELFFFIYDAKAQKVLSERYMIALSQHCLPRDPEKINQCFSIFTDLDSNDLNNKDLYLACHIVRIGHDLETKKTAMPLRKPHGAAVHPLHTLLSSKLHDERDVQMEVFVCPPADYHKLLDSIIRRQGVFHPTDKGTGVFISLRPLWGNIGKVKEENTLLFRKFTAECQKLGFPEIIRPYDVRHDVYLTLQNGLFNKGTKRADKNVEVDVEVLDSKENSIPHCLSPGIGEAMVTSFHSLVQYHTAAPTFNETIKLMISPEMMHTARVKFSFYHRSTISSRLGKMEPFAVAHLKLMKEDGTTIEDNTHELFVYKFRETSRGAFRYTTLPCVNDPTRQHLFSPDLLVPKDNFFIRTQVCSTKLTQNADLHCLLNWRKMDEKRLPRVVENVTRVPGDEIVKFLADTFNALFTIMEEKGDMLGDDVFEALVLTIGLLGVEKYENFRPVLDTYCNTLFQAANVHTLLVVKMKHVFEQVMLVDGTRSMKAATMQKTFKAAEFLIKFIMKSRSIYDEATQGKGAEQFLRGLEDLLQTTCLLMKVECPENELVAPRAQAQALQFFPQTFDLFLSVMSVHTLGSIVSQFLSNLKETKLKIYKAVFVSSVISSELFRHKESRVMIVPAILRHLCHHINNRDDNLDKSLDALGSILLMLHQQDSVTVDTEVCMLTTEMLHVLFKCFMELTSGAKREKVSLVGHCVANMLALLELMSPRHYQVLRASFNTAADLEEFILHTFTAFCELVALDLYSNDWTILKLQANYVVLRATTQLSQILVEDFLGTRQNSDPSFFNPSLWQNFFSLAVAFTVQRSLQLEQLGEVKRNRILDSYGDMRIAMNTLMIAKWRALGHFQARYVPAMIGPFLEVSLIPHTAIRRATIPIFYDMMELEYKHRRNFHMMETEMIDKLDVFISGGMGDANYRHLVNVMLTERCRANPKMEGEGGRQFIESVVELLRRLLDFRTVQQGDEYRDLHMHVMFSLLNFYKEMGREEIYIRYIYHLAELHKASHNWVEAANTLLLHAELLQWSSTMQKQEGAFPRQTSAERKEALYDEIITLFDKGKLWECGIEQCKAIASQLETVTYNFEKLSQIHQTIARFYHSIIHELRAEPEYFRVGFFGGFPPFLKNKVFIFRGHEFEKLAEFNTRLYSIFPNARFMKTLETPGLDILESRDQYIQSSSVEPIPEPDLMAKFEGKSVQEQVIRFFRINHVRRFMLKRPFHRGQRDKTNEYKTLHVDRIVYTTTHRFPSILRWFEVKSTDTTTLNPVQNGIEMVMDNVEQLKTVIQRIRNDSTHSTNPLTMKLNGSLDAAVNGGVSMFEVFFTQQFQEINPECKPHIPKLRFLMEELSKVLTEGVALHSKVRPDSMRGLHERLEEQLQKYTARYDTFSNGDYERYEVGPYRPHPETPPTRRPSSSTQRRGSQKRVVSGGSDRSFIVSSRPSSVHYEGGGGGGTVEKRDRASTEMPRDMPARFDPAHLDSANRERRDYDAVPPVPVKKKSTAHLHSPASQRANGVPPTIPPHRTSTVSTPQGEEAPPPPPVRRNMTSVAMNPPAAPTVTSSSPPPFIPPRSHSVRQNSRLSGSSFDSASLELPEHSPTSTPQDGGTPVSAHCEISARGGGEPGEVGGEVAPAVPTKRSSNASSSGGGEEGDVPPPPPPKTTNRGSQGEVAKTAPTESSSVL